MAEVFIGLVEAFFALIELLIHALISSITLILYPCSRRFRERKKAEWKGSRISKYAELGWSGVCLAGVVLLLANVAMPERRTERATNIKFEKPMAGEDVRLKLLSETNTGVRIVVKDRGLVKILGAENMQQLKTQLAGNVQVIPPNATNSSSVSAATE